MWYKELKIASNSCNKKNFYVKNLKVEYTKI